MLNKKTKPPKKVTARHLEIMEDYCNGEIFTHIRQKFGVNRSYISEIAKAVGIDPRPTSFCSYKYAHAWVVKAKKQYEAAKNTKSECVASVNQDHQHDS